MKNSALNSTKNKSENRNKLMLFSYIFVIIGTIVGAGFSSGREIAEFFGIFGNIAPLIAILFGLLTFVGLQSFISFDHQEIDIKTHKFINIFIIIASAISLSSMIAGLSSIIDIVLGNQIYFWIILVLCYFILTKGLNGISKANLILMPITIVLLLLLTILTITKNGANYNFIKAESSFFQLISYPFLYYGLNIFTCFPIAKEFAPLLSTKQKRYSSIFIAGLLTVFVILIQFSILRSENDYSSYDIPTLLLSVENFPTLGIFTSIAIAIGIITTLLSCGFIIQKELKKKINNTHLSTLIPLVCCYLLSLLGFSNIVKYVYPITGTFGVALTIYVIIKSILKKQKNRTKIS